jgi:hypothetical protein
VNVSELLSIILVILSFADKSHDGDEAGKRGVSYLPSGERHDGRVCLGDEEFGKWINGLELTVKSDEDVQLDVMTRGEEK